MLLILLLAVHYKQRLWFKKSSQNFLLRWIYWDKCLEGNRRVVFSLIQLTSYWLYSIRSIVSYTHHQRKEVYSFYHNVHFTDPVTLWSIYCKLIPSAIFTSSIHLLLQLSAYLWNAIFRIGWVSRFYLQEICLQTIYRNLYLDRSNSGSEYLSLDSTLSLATFLRITFQLLTIDSPGFLSFRKYSAYRPFE